MLPFDTQPEFVNEIGVKWWRDASTTDYANREDQRGASLDAVGFFIERPGGYRSRVLVARSGKVLAEDQTLEGMGIKIDLLKFLQN